VGEAPKIGVLYDWPGAGGSKWWSHEARAAVERPDHAKPGRVWTRPGRADDQGIDISAFQDRAGFQVP
jgi:hypothetical protein